MKQCSNQVLPYYDQQSGYYWLQLNSDRYSRMNHDSLNLHLRRQGLRKDQYVGELSALNELENAVAVAQIDRRTDYAGPLAGHNAGPFRTQDGRCILVTSSPSPVQPKRGATPLLDKFFDQLLGEEQGYFHSWMQCALVSLAEHDFRASQLLCLVGEAGCGKSLLQQLITVLLGGRLCKPFKYMTGETQFNADLAMAEHWCIEDDHASTDIRLRRKFGSSIKEVCVNQNMFIRGLYAQAVVLETFRRITASMNIEKENTHLIPPMDESLADKITILKCGKAEIDGNKIRAWKSLTAELPGYVQWLLNVFKIPKDMRCPRYGVKSYQNPEILEEVACDSPETRLLALIDQVIFPPQAMSHLPEKMTADELERRLRGSNLAFAADKLLYFSSACGVYLSRIAKKNPARVKPGGNAARREWIISEAS